MRRHDLDRILSSADPDAAPVSLAFPMAQKIFEGPPSLGDHFVHQLQHAFCICGEGIGPPQGVETMTHQERQRSGDQFPCHQFRSDRSKQRLGIDLAAFVGVAIVAHQLVNFPVLLNPFRLGYFWMNGAIILGKRQWVQWILRIDYRPQQRYDGLRDRVPAQMQAFRGPRRDAPIHEVLRKGCAVSVSPQEHGDVRECKMGGRIRRRFVSKRTVFITQAPSRVTENALEHPFVSLRLFVDVLRLN